MTIVKIHEIDTSTGIDYALIDSDTKQIYAMQSSFFGDLMTFDGFDYDECHACLANLDHPRIEVALNYTAHIKDHYVFIDFVPTDDKGTRKRCHVIVAGRWLKRIVTALK